jgi:hypothetical protein
LPKLPSIVFAGPEVAALPASYKLLQLAKVMNRHRQTAGQVVVQPKSAFWQSTGSDLGRRKLADLVDASAPLCGLGRFFEFWTSHGPDRGGMALLLVDGTKLALHFLSDFIFGAK